MIIMIPSRSRAERLSRGLISQMSPNWLDRTMVFVPSSQYDQYTMHLPGSVRVVALAEEIRIARKREIMGQWALDTGERTFMFVDDDVGFLVRRSSVEWQLRGQEPADFDLMMQHVQALLTEGSDPY